MRARLDAALTFDVRDLPPKAVESLCCELSFPARGVRHRSVEAAGEGTGAVCYIEQRGREMRLPRGAIHILRQVAAESQLTVTCDDVRVLPQAEMALPDLSLRSYQRAAVEQLVKETQGVVVLPCGSGKTYIGMGAIVRLRTPTLILVHTLDLAEQWRSELRDKLGVDAGFVGDGERRPGLVTVAVIQSLARWPRAELEAFLGRYGLLILDEAHHVPAWTFQAVVGRCPARYRLGLTATPHREDGLGDVLELFLGGPLLVVTQEELVAAGVLTLPQLRIIDTDFSYPYADANQYGAMLSALVAHEERNRQIVDAVSAEARAGHICLVLSGRVDHCEQIAESLTRRGIAAAALTSGVNRRRRKALLDLARAGQLSALTATSLADEGLDLPRLSRVFLVYPGRARGRTVQRLGRLMRPHADKGDAVLFDFVDRNVPILRRHHLERQKLYAEVLSAAAPRAGQRRGRRGTPA